MSDLPHLRIEGGFVPVAYTYAGGGGGGEFRLPPRDRLPHAEKLKAELQQTQDDAVARREAAAEPIGHGEVIAIRSEQGFGLKLDSLERRRSGIELLSVRNEDGVTVAKLFVPRGKFVLLLRLIEAYETKTTATKGAPRNKELIESIASIRLAAVRDFWQDEIAFPEADQSLWWEVWLRAEAQDPPGERHADFRQIAGQRGLRVSGQFVLFPERVVTLTYGSASALGASSELLSRVAELRAAKEVATDYRELRAADQADFVRELASRIVPPSDDAPAVCILDSGVNREHPLLTAALAPADTHSIRPEQWGTADDSRQHGTRMAGVALYGCLTAAFPTTGPYLLRHRLESVKFLPPPPGQNEVKDYGPFTEQAVSRAEIQAPNRRRAICMAVTADDRDLGMPSLWSGTVDQLVAGALDDRTRLMFISAGNLRDEISDPGYVYHTWNCEHGGIEDPAQAWNAVTVGAYTEKVFIRQGDYAGWQPIAQAGDLCPTSRTSLPWSSENQDGWPIKPDIVMEGGNYAHQGIDRAQPDDLALLTTVLPAGAENGRLLETTGDTSPATAAAARMAAIIWSQYPSLWPETVRGLMIHSARWTPRMSARFPQTPKASVQRCLRCYGYGVPSLQRALWSAENAATLIFEGELSPYHKVGGEVRSNEMLVHRLPWPVEVLQALGEAQVTVRVTLSYMIEPSPGRIGWTRKHRYQSHGLRFDVNRPQEDEEAFKQRLSRSEWDEPDQRPDNVTETRPWVVGDQGRRRGSVHSDWWTGPAADVAVTNLIAVHPVTGWWRERPHLGRYERAAKYSLIVSVEAPEIEVDLYAAIAAEATVITEVER